MTDYANDDFKPGLEQTEGVQGHSGSAKSELGKCYSAAQQPCMDCELTVLMNNMGHATKVFDLDDAGQLRKRSAASII